MMIYLGIFLACGCGALLRYTLMNLLKRPAPLATLLANLLACFLLGYFSKTLGEGQTYLILGTGFCGGLSTFSTFQAELIEKSCKPRWLVFYLLLSYCLGCLLLIGGRMLAS